MIPPEVQCNTSKGAHHPITPNAPRYRDAELSGAQGSCTGGGQYLAPDLVLRLVACRKVLVKASIEPLTTTLASFLVCTVSIEVRILGSSLVEMTPHVVAVREVAFASTFCHVFTIESSCDLVTKTFSNAGDL